MVCGNVQVPPGVMINCGKQGTLGNGYGYRYLAGMFNVYSHLVCVVYVLTMLFNKYTITSHASMLPPNSYLHPTHAAPNTHDSLPRIFNLVA